MLPKCVEEKSRCLGLIYHQLKPLDRDFLLSFGQGELLSEGGCGHTSRFFLDSNSYYTLYRVSQGLDIRMLNTQCPFGKRGIQLGA